MNLPDTPNATVNNISARAVAHVHQEDISLGPPHDPDSETIGGPKSWRGRAVLERYLPVEEAYDPLRYDGPIMIRGEEQRCRGTIFITDAPSLVVSADKTDGDYPRVLRGTIYEFEFVGSGAPEIYEMA